MNQDVYYLIEDERERQDTAPGNSNNHSDSVWIALIVKQLGQAMEAGQNYLFATEHNSIRKEAAWDDHKKQVVQATALCVAWLEEIVTSEPLR